MKTQNSLVLLLGVSLAASCTKVEEKPNILWLTYEDTSPQFIGCYGNPDAKTPNIDKLAEEGVRYDCAFSTAAVSSPSRFALFTGMHGAKYSSGHHRSSYPMPEHIKGFATYLRQAGYYTTNNSKTDYNIAGANRYVKEAWDESSETADWRTRAEGQPFFAIYNSFPSHQSRVMTNPWDVYTSQVLDHLTDEEKTEGGSLEMPTFYNDSPEMQRQHSRVYNALTLTDKEFGEWIAKLEEDGLRENTIIFCFADHGEGITRGKSSHYGLSYRVPFVAYFPEKFAHLSPHGTAGVVTDELISFEDMATTMLSICGVEVPEYLEGRIFLGEDREAEKKYHYPSTDRADQSTDMCRSVTDGEYIYTRVFYPFMPSVQWNKYFDVSELNKEMRSDLKGGNLNELQSRIFEPRFSEYLFNIKEDKWEEKNLINSPEQQERISEMRSALTTRLLDIRDAHFIPEYYLLTDDKPIPYEVRKDNAFYPVEEVVALTMLPLGEASTVEAQLQALRHSSPVMRYWAAVGLYSATSLSEMAVTPLMESLATLEPSPAKAFVAAALVKFYNSSEAKEALKELLKHDNGELARTAMQAIMYLENSQKSEFCWAIEEVAALQKGESALAGYCDVYLYYEGKRDTLSYSTWW